MKMFVRLQDLKVIPGTPEWSELSEDEQLRQLRKMFSFLPEGSSFSLADGVVTITVPEQSQDKLSEGDRLLQKAEKRAKQGEFEKARSIYERVVELQPGAVLPLRNLAMVCYELQDFEEAKNHLIDALRLDSKDAWSLVILGNIYVRVDDDKETAISLYKSALDIKPDDPWTLNGLATAEAELGRLEESINYYNRAISSDATFANAYLGKAMALVRLERYSEAKEILAKMFVHAKEQDARTKPVLQDARNTFLRLCNILANNQVSESFKVVENLKAEAQEKSGYPVISERGELDAKIAGSIQMAWKHSRDYHRLIVREGNTVEILIHHITAHEIEHVLMESAARAVNRNKWFTLTQESRQSAVASLRSDIRKLEKKGYPQDRVADVVSTMISGAAGFLFNTPLDMIIESRLKADFPTFNDAQYCGVFSLAQEASNTTFNQEIRSLVPAAILRINDTLNGTYAIFVDHLFNGASAFSDAYRKLPTFSRSEELFNIWRQAYSGGELQPGDEYGIVDSFANRLGIRDWYTWIDDPGTHSIETSRREVREGTTNPELLKQKAPASVMFLLSALERYEDMPDTKIREVLMEIALLGMNGLDYSSPEKKYTLNSLPVEKFSGLQLMCLMYAASQRVMPGESMGMDLNDEYLQALQLFRPKS